LGFIGKQADPAAWEKLAQLIVLETLRYHAAEAVKSKGHRNPD